MKIGIISDTHGTFDKPFRDFFSDVEEIWHAGDIGTIELADKIAEFKPLRAVYGNIDGGATRIAYHEFARFECQGARVMMTHIGGYPGRYSPAVSAAIKRERPTIFICGHSHILRVGYDKHNSLLYINPGAAGTHGFHDVRTALKLEIIDGKPDNLEVFEFPRKQ